MADAMISVVVRRAADIVEHKIVSEWNLLRGVEKEILYVSKKLATIRSVLDDAESRGFKEISVKKWLRRLDDIAYEMDDILDEWEYALLKQQEGVRSNDPKKKICCCSIPSSSWCLCFQKFLVRRDIAKKIQDVKAKLDQIIKEKDDFGFVNSQSTPTNDVPKTFRIQSTSLVEVEKVCGRDEDRDTIVSKVMLNDDGVQILSIVGMGGLGKTTLAQLVYNDPRVQHCFDFKIWICVSDPFDVAGVARGIIESVTKESFDPNIKQLELVLEKLRGCISGKRLLLVLDDVWTEDYREWKDLKVTLGHCAAGSTILVTTRNTNVARMIGTIHNNIHLPRHLSDEECWRMLKCISLPERSEEECRDFEYIGKKIARKCKGLPLAANVLGSVLQFKSSLDSWQSVLESPIWRLEEVEVDLFPHLVLSYNELSPSLKRCFSYCAIYPKDSKIDVDRLIEEWMALGFLGPVSGNGLELKGREHFNILATRSFFQDFEESDGSIVRCKMHDLIHDFALFLKGKNDRSHEGEANGTKRRCQTCCPLLASQVQEYRRLFLGVDSPVMYFCDCFSTARVLRMEQHSDSDFPPGMEKLIHLRLLHLGGGGSYNEQLKTICGFYFLQTLLLPSCALEQVPIEIKNLVELRRLNLSNNVDLKELPDSICSLIELRSLDLDFCYSLRRLPEGINRLRKLQHLTIRGTPARRCLPRGLGELSELRTLIGYCAGSGGSKLGLLKKLNGLSGFLSLEIMITSSSDLEELVKDAQEAELRSKDRIHRLNIHFENDKVEGCSPWMEVMEALQTNLQKLNELAIWGYGGFRLPQWVSSPFSRVKDLSLIRFDELWMLPPLGKLPFLELLTLVYMKELRDVGIELLGLESSTSTTKEAVVAFPKLKKLYINTFPKWSKWKDITAEEEESNLVSIMPCLEELHIKSCEGLNALPHRLLNKASSSLRILKITDSPQLKRQYGDKDGSQWRSISQSNPQLQLLLN